MAEKVLRFIAESIGAVIGTILSIPYAWYRGVRRINFAYETGIAGCTSIIDYLIQFAACIVAILVVTVAVPVYAVITIITGIICKFETMFC